MVESDMADDRKPIVASTQDIHEYIENAISYKGTQTDKVDVQMLPKLLHYVIEETENVGKDTVNVVDKIVNVLGTEENDNDSVTEEDRNLFCQEGKMGQLKEHFRKTDLDLTKKELENVKYVTEDTQKD
ncbi:Hypothetical predicted protein [Mytilus galloprovincialis]|uniref:Uncharacterized protein n=1 Tax=Mytilus galloprovincialis TaxID=29158 RepID=A0A8B6BY38_MYTGA|nr:Hypothetical predicted protein [Mytilus galloprovincialis]